MWARSPRTRSWERSKTICSAWSTSSLVSPTRSRPSRAISWPARIEPSQSGCLLDDAGVVLDVRSGGDQRRELGDAGGAADLLELAPLLELVRERDRVHGLALGPQREAGAVDRAVRAAVEIGGVDDLGDRADRGLGEEHRAENRLLGLEVLGWHVAQRWCVGRAHGAGSNLSRAVTSRNGPPW